MAQGNFIKKTLEAIKRRPQRSYKKKSGCGLKRKPTPYPLRHHAGDSSISLPEDQQVQPMPNPKREGPRAYGLMITPTPVPIRGAKKARRVSVAPGIQEAAEESEEVEVLGCHLEKLNLSSRVHGALVTIVAQGFEVERDLTQAPPAKECSEAPRHVSTLEPLPSKPKREGQSHFGGLKRRPSPFPSKQGLGLLDSTETAASACFIDKHRYAWHVDAVKVDFLPDALRKHVDSQLQSTERLRLPKPGPSPLCQAYVLPEPEVDYEPDIPSKVGYICPLSAGDQRGHDIGSGLRRVPTPISGVGGI